MFLPFSSLMFSENDLINIPPQEEQHSVFEQHKQTHVTNVLLITITEVFLFHNIHY